MRSTAQPTMRKDQFERADIDLPLLQLTYTPDWFVHHR